MHLPQVTEERLFDGIGSSFYDTSLLPNARKLTNFFTSGISSSNGSHIIAMNAGVTQFIDDPTLHEAFCP